MIDFNKFLIVLKREYLTRIKSKAYILTTLLAPVVFIMFIALIALIPLLSPDTTRLVAIVDETNAIAYRMLETDPNQYRVFPNAEISDIRKMINDGIIQGYVVITEDILGGSEQPELIYGGSGGINFITKVQRDLRSAIREENLDRANVTEEVREIMTKNVSLVTRVLTDTGEEEQDTGALMIVGLILGFTVYGSMFAYGGIVMRGVIEEKASRIIEVVVSSVRPFELLLGKVFGVGALALTQFAFWIAAGAGIMAISTPVLMYFAGSSAANPQAVSEADLPFTMPTIGGELIVFFLIFFLLGYLMYSAMFAAVGSALESETENQQLMLLVTLPIIIPIFFLGTVAADPDSTLSTILSLIPFFSPIIMPTRMAIMNVPFWEVGLGIFLLIATFLGLMWLSARIYRIGILMYGKSASFSELSKWIRYK